MGISNNELLKFNAQVLLNKREILESFEQFIEYVNSDESNESYTREQKSILLPLCEEFKTVIQGCNIPQLTKPWYYYEYNLSYEGLSLDMLLCDYVDFDENDEIASMDSTVEYSIVKTECAYLTVEEYARLNGVTVTTVRQWIRRGKLRTAKKNGRNWKIPALSPSPRRGFESVFYYWEYLPNSIEKQFPYLKDSKGIYIYQDEEDKKRFFVRIDSINKKATTLIELTASEREQLELAMISSQNVDVSLMDDMIQYVPGKQRYSYPVLTFHNQELTYGLGEIMVKTENDQTFCFDMNDRAGMIFNGYSPEEYVIPIHWEFWEYLGEDMSEYDAMNEEALKYTKVADLTGCLLLCPNMIEDGYDPLIVCDDLSGDLCNIMAEMMFDGGPLNSQNSDPSENVLYIHEFELREEYKRKGIGNRIMAEIPWLCKRALHVWPDIMAYYISESMERYEKKEVVKFYNENGFKPLQDEHYVYAYTKW